MFNSGEYSSGEVFPNQVKKRRIQIAVKALLALVVLAACSAVVYFAIQLPQSSTAQSRVQGSASERLSSDELIVKQSYLSQTDVTQAQSHLDLLKALQLNVESELSHNPEELVSLKRTEQGFIYTGELQLTFYNHSDIYVEVHDFVPAFHQRAQQSYQVDFALKSDAQTQVNDRQSGVLVLPPLGKQSMKLVYSAAGKCAVRSFVFDWQYQAKIRTEALDFIFQQNQALKRGASEATRYQYQQSQVVTNFANLKAYREKWSDFCQYEI